MIRSAASPPDSATIAAAGTAQPAASGEAVGAVLLPSARLQVQLLPHARVRWRDGRVSEVAALPGPPPPGAPVLLPGLIDLHIHWPQAHIRGAFGGQLLPWLRDAIWPAEAAFADEDEARRRAIAFVGETLRAGTCAGLFFGAPFASASAIFAQVAPRGWLEGPALMERNGPQALLCPVGDTLRALEQTGRPAHQPIAVTPRFAPNLSAEGLRTCGEFARQRALPIQSHLSENQDELRWVAELFADATDYLDVYDRAGLLGPRAIFAHGIHLSDGELARLAQTGTTIAHCPTSNIALGSGRMAVERLRRAGVPWVLATDVGAGPCLSMLDAMKDFLNVHQGFADVTAVEALCRSTAVPGQWLAQFDAGLQGLGTLQPGAPAHLIALPMADAVEPEGLIRSWLQGDAHQLERLPSAVWCWGNAVPLQ